MVGSAATMARWRSSVKKVVVFIKKLPHVSMDEFIRYYEDRHVPLVNELLPFYALYRRNYLETALYPEGVAKDFDVVTELGFADEDHYQAWLTALSDPDVIARIREDEANFLDSSATVMWGVSAHDD